MALTDQQANELAGMRSRGAAALTMIERGMLESWCAHGAPSPYERSAINALVGDLESKPLPKVDEKKVAAAIESGRAEARERFARDERMAGGR